MSGHGAIFGITQSGKSFLAKRMIQGLNSKGKRCVVYDPFLTRWDGAKEVTDDWQRLIALVSHVPSLRVFIDEIGQLPKDRWEDLRTLYSCARHAQHYITVIGQRGEQVPPIVRENADYIWLFRQGERGARFWADAKGDESLMWAARSDFPKYHFVHYRPFEKSFVGKVNA